MFRHITIDLKLFLTTLLLVIGIHSNSFFSLQTIAQTTINKNPESYSELIAKKTGGRSGGGSFKKKSSSSSSRSRKSPTPNQSRFSNSHHNSINSREKRDRYNLTPNNNYSPKKTYHRDSYNNPSNHKNYHRKQQAKSNSIVRFIFFLIVAVVIFIPLFLLFAFVGTWFNRENRETRKAQKEINNNKVTVSKIQVALSSQAEGIQQELSELSLAVNTDNQEELLELVRDSSLLLIRNSQAWNHVLTSSVSMNIEKAEAAFNSLSVAERSKYSQETLTNVNGKIQIKQPSNNNNQNDFFAYLVVTLLVGTVDDKPLFSKINTEQDLETALLKLAAMKTDYLMKFELLWSPQTEGTYLTDEEFLMQYTDMIPLV